MERAAGEEAQCCGGGVAWKGQDPGGGGGGREKSAGSRGQDKFTVVKAGADASLTCFWVLALGLVLAASLMFSRRSCMAVAGG